MTDAQARKRPRVDDRTLRDSNTPHKKPRLSARPNFPPEFWDRLSKIPLTGRALRELDRRNRIQLPPSPGLQPGELPSSLAKFARCGGPDILDLRGYTPPTSAAALGSSTQRTHELPSKSGMAPTTIKASTTSRGPDFEQHLVDHGIYLNNRKSAPLNIRYIRDRLRRSRPSLSPCRFSDEDFEALKHTNETIATEDDVVAKIVPAMCGTNEIFSGRNLLFTELKPITDGTATKPKPEVFDGAHFDDIDKRIYTNENIYPLIIPTKHLHVPVAPNFFIEVKSQSGDFAVLKRQACYDGAHGARAMHCLQNYGREEPIYDGNTYAFSATYHPGMKTLVLYAHHLTAPASSGEGPEYHQTELYGYYLMNDREALVAGLTTFRNLRDMAQEFRDDFIKDANAHAQGGRVEKNEISKKKRAPPRKVLAEDDTLISPRASEAKREDSSK